MQYLTIKKLANRLDRSPWTLQKWVARRKLPGRKLGGTWITTERELRDYLRGVPVEKIDLVQLYDIQSAAAKFEMTVPAVRRMIREDALKGKHVDSRGGGPKGGTMVFNTAQMNRAKPHIDKYKDARPGRPVKGNIDDIVYPVEATDGKKTVIWWHVKGTHNEMGLELAYKHLHQARSRARESRALPLRYSKGDYVTIYLPAWEEGERCHKADLQHDVTGICRGAFAVVRDADSKLDGQELLTPTNGILGLISYDDTVKTTASAASKEVAPTSTD